MWKMIIILYMAMTQFSLKHVRQIDGTLDDEVYQENLDGFAQKMCRETTNAIIMKQHVHVFLN